VVQASDGGYIVAASGDSDIYLLKTTSAGSQVWLQKLAGAGLLGGMVLSDDGKLVIVGSAIAQGSSNYDIWLVKFDLTERLPSGLVVATALACVMVGSLGVSAKKERKKLKQKNTKNS